MALLYKPYLPAINLIVTADYTIDVIFNDVKLDNS